MPLRLNRRMQNVTNEYFQQELTHQADHILELTKDVIPYCVEISDETIKFIYLTGVKADAPEGTRPYELGFNLHYSLEEQKGEKGINFHDYGSVWTRGEEGSKQGASALLATMRSEERRVGKECRSRWSPY